MFKERYKCLLIPFDETNLLEYDNNTNVENHFVPESPNSPSATPTSLVCLLHPPIKRVLWDIRIWIENPLDPIF